MSGIVLGIDLGTTNSEVAALRGGRVEVLGAGILPSCVGLSPDGELLVGEAARNQLLVYPERTVRSIKRRMGTSETVTMGDRTLTPQEVSSLILRELAAWAERDLGERVERAVITVPAYFSDAQRQATREAGALAGLDVVRILNEPTAAALAYGFGEGEHRRALIYDLGGGTFDVSVVSVEDGVTEVLASHGNNRLGGDDFDDLLVAHLERCFGERHGVALRTVGGAASLARLRRAAEEAKRRLSAEPYARVVEESLAVVEGRPLHLDVEVSREAYEEMVAPLLESTLDSVSRALQDADLRPDQLDEVLLVGGSTRTPMVGRLLEEKCGRAPRQDVHPDLCVALGAGVLASRVAGHEVDRVLVDVSPFSFGPSYLGVRGGVPYPHCYHPVIRRNTPLPVTRTERYYTSVPFQTEVVVELFQGDDEDALKNIPVGSFRFEGLRSTADDNEVLCRMSLDVDGILQVTATEKATGRTVETTIRNALRPKSAAEIDEARRRLEALYEGRGTTMARAGWDEPSEDEGTTWVDVASPARWAPPDAFGAEARALVERSRGRLDQMHAEDADEAIALHERIEEALGSRDATALKEAEEELRELLFFVEAH